MSTTEMREPTLLVLTSLAGGRKHGYGLIGDAADLSDGRVRLKVGTLYAVLDRLLDQGLVAPAGEEVVDGRLRRYFELTDAGAGALDAEVRRIEANAAAARTRLAAWRPGTATRSIHIRLGGVS
ncbi:MULTISPECIES: PadR family transcriptional regulator [unclassified Curtobacterium]|jgi:DNA-binding PadR family transcriptional regulator|uniref:PadR family transcriptional regulator n=1 Tax=unclassified Curtobacterium TaxID=257496 RepID=UPI00188C3507|nr:MULTISPECIES: PadR family transcriptional regulator [unclassified Curtobacterium]MBF4589439.1 helix-turn-helix transcriptional regulator [Curtobacterium sp. VKM Ac-1395]MCY1695746.1 PadR family transcriptional regulator [Curtobacterium sp. SL109]